MATVLVYSSGRACNFHEAVEDDLQDLRTSERLLFSAPAIYSYEEKWKTSVVFWLICLARGVKMFR